MCVDYVLTSSKIAQVDPDDGPFSKVVLSQLICPTIGDFPSPEIHTGTSKLKLIKAIIDPRGSISLFWVRKSSLDFCHNHVTQQIYGPTRTDVIDVIIGVQIF
jgi:hypothetical protein